MGVLSVAAGNHKISEPYHEVLKVYAGRAIEGAFLAGQAIPERFVSKTIGIQGNTLHNVAGASVGNKLAVELEHGANRRTLAALETEVQAVSLDEDADFPAQFPPGQCMAFYAGASHVTLLYKAGC
jgi:hypothetical protein